MSDMHVVFCVLIACSKMDPCFKHYEMSRFRFGLDTELDPQQLVLATQTNDQNVCKKMSPYVVSLKVKRADGTIVPAGSGFHAINSTHSVVYSAHVVPSGPEELVAYYPDGQPGRTKVIAKDYATDVALVKVDRPCRLPTLLFRSASVGDTVYILGFSGTSSQLNFTKGMVSSLHPGGFTATAYADNGFSGGPVLSLHMEVLGMVRGGAGQTQGPTNQQVSCVNVDAINGFVGAALALQPNMDKWP